MEPTQRCVIVTPTFNSERFLDETIASVLLQAAPDVAIDYHVQDGGSSDGTEAVVRGWIDRLASLPRLARSVSLTWASACDRGMYEAINRGMAALAPQPGDAVTWINSDDRLAPGAVATVTRVFADHPSCEFVSGRTALLNEAGSIVSITYPQAYGRAALAAGAHDGRGQAFIMQEGTFFTGRVWQAVGGVDADFRLAGDWDLWRRMARETAHFSIDTVTAFHRRRAGQLSADLDRYHAEVDARAPVPPEPVDAALPELIRYDPDAERWIRAPFDALASRPPLAVIDGVRRPACAIAYLDGFGAPEGPYPEYRLPAGVRWLRGPWAEIALEAPYDGAYRVTLTLRATAVDLVLGLHLNGVPLAEVPLAPPVPDTDQLVAVTAWLGVGRNVLELEVPDPSDAPRLLLVVGCTVVAEADRGWEAPREAAVPGGELLRAVKATALVVRAADNATQLAETIACARAIAGPALFVAAEPGTDAEGVAATLAPYADRVRPDDDQLRATGYRAALELAEGDRLHPDALAGLHRALRDRGAASVAGLVELTDGAGRVVARLLPESDAPLLRDLADDGGLPPLRAPLVVAARRAGERGPIAVGEPPRVWIVDRGGAPAGTSPLFSLAGALRMLGVDARVARDAPPGAGLVIAAPGTPFEDTADLLAVSTDDGLELRSRDGAAVMTLPAAIDAETFRPRARGPARVALGLPADGFLILADAAAAAAAAQGAPPGARVLTLAAAATGGPAMLPMPSDADTLAHVVAAFDAAVAAPGSWLALAGPACGVPTFDPGARREDAFAPALRRLARSRAAARLQSAEARAGIERAATVEALALAIHQQAAALPPLAAWLSRRRHLEAGAIAVPTDAPAGLEPPVAQHRGFALQPLAGAVAEHDPTWGRTLRLSAAEAVLLLRLEDLSGSALRLHLTGPAGSALTVALDGDAPVPLRVGDQPVTTVRIAAALAPGLHRVALRAADGAAGTTRIVAWELVNTRAVPAPERERTRLWAAPLAGRMVATPARDGDWRPVAGFLEPETPHPAAGLHTPFRWTRGDAATFVLRVERGGRRTIDLAITGIAAGLRVRLAAAGTTTAWSAPLDAYVGRVSHARWALDLPVGDVALRVELADRAANPRDLGVLILGVTLA